MKFSVIILFFLISFLSCGAFAEETPVNTLNTGTTIDNGNSSKSLDAPDNVLDNIADRFKSSVERATDVITPIALELFGLLALIDLVWTFGMMMLRQGNLQDLITGLVKKTIFFSFFLAFLHNSKDWSYYIVDRFREMSNLVSQGMGESTSISPSNIFDIGLRISAQVIDTVSFMHPGDSLGIFISGIILFLCFTLISGLLILAIVEIYFAINIGVIFLGFGGSSWTSPFAKNYITYIVGLAVKIFVMQIIIGVGQSLINEAIVNFGTNNSQVLVLMGTSVVLLMLVKSIPDSLKSIISSIGSHNGEIIGAGAAFAGGAVGTAAGAVGASMAIGKTSLGLGSVASQAIQYGAAIHGKDGFGAKAAGSAVSSMAKHGYSELKGHFANQTQKNSSFSNIASKIKEDRMAHGKNNMSQGDFEKNNGEGL